MSLETPCAPELGKAVHQPVGEGGCGGSPSMTRSRQCEMSYISGGLQAQLLNMSCDQSAAHSGSVWPVGHGIHVFTLAGPSLCSLESMA